MWGLLTGAASLTVLIAVLAEGPSGRSSEPPSSWIAQETVAVESLLLDAAPTPMLVVEGGRARALNRAARRMFGTDDGLVISPDGLLDQEAKHIRHEGRDWRADRVMLNERGKVRMVVALIDLEQEERTAEARATASLIHVLGHELLNGIAPIASLADSAAAAIKQRDVDLPLVKEILGTLVRRADGLQRFIQVYRTMARLPEPLPRSVELAPMLQDLARLFVGMYPSIKFSLNVEFEHRARWSIDRDQIDQAIWALLQNAAEASSASGHDPTVLLVARQRGSMLEIDVQDNGPGVRTDEAVRIFRPFHTTKTEGTGIGLSVSRQIAHAHGGTLTLVPVIMTTFRLRLPGLSGCSA